MVTTFTETQMAADAINVYNPASDVTDASPIKAILREKGAIGKPNTNSPFECLRS